MLTIREMKLSLVSSRISRDLGFREESLDESTQRSIVASEVFSLWKSLYLPFTLSASWEKLDLKSKRKIVVSRDKVNLFEEE